MSPADMVRRAIQEGFSAGRTGIATTTGVTKWGTDDCRWFACHPDRSFRLRRLYPGEWPLHSGATTHVIVRQLAPGVRDKEAVDSTVGASFLDNMPAHDTLLMAMWQQIRANKDGLVLVGDVAKAFRKMQEAGHG